MKLSIAWIFDHINAAYTQVNMPELMTLFNQKVAEIEGFYTSKIDLSSLYLAQVLTSAEQVEVSVPELNMNATLAKRDGLQSGRWYMIKKVQNGYRWAHEADLGGEKDSLLPQLASDEQDAKGGWEAADTCRRLYSRN